MRTLLIDDMGKSYTIHFWYDIVGKLHKRAVCNITGKKVGLGSYRGNSTLLATYLNTVLEQHLKITR